MTTTKKTTTITGKKKAELFRASLRLLKIQHYDDDLMRFFGSSPDSDGDFEIESGGWLHEDTVADLLVGTWARQCDNVGVIFNVSAEPCEWRYQVRGLRDTEAEVADCPWEAIELAVEIADEDGEMIVTLHDGTKKRLTTEVMYDVRDCSTVPQGDDDDDEDNN